jgi:3-deoxy-7-phosphoheptulonate synthase
MRKLVARNPDADPTVISIRRDSLPPVEIGGRSIAVTAGPCAVEDRRMLLDVARAVKAAGAAMLRGGAFKPRSSPYAFQGLGAEALDLLAEARAETGLLIVTEVLDPRDVELVAQHADVMQVGTRNMQNYALLAELGRAGRPVLLKRGYAATIDELLLAAEHVMANGNRDVILCERGIRTFETRTRNTLDVAAVPVLKAETHLPVIVDPSHAAGRADLVAPLAFAAIAAGADGLLIEVHPEPESARSDGEQALTPDAFATLMRRVAVLAAVIGRHLRLVAKDRLATEQASPEDEAYAHALPDSLKHVRGEIEHIDRELVSLIVRRVLLAREAGFVKREAGLPVVDPVQERLVLARARALADEAGLPYPELRELLRHVIAVSRRAQILDVASESHLEAR